MEPVGLLFAPVTTADLNENNDPGQPHSERLDIISCPELKSRLLKSNTLKDLEFADLVQRMTLGEKSRPTSCLSIAARHQEAKQYKIGSVLNGGGVVGLMKQTATARDWALQSDRHWLALDEAYAGRVLNSIYVGTDAVHAYNNVFGATLFSLSALWRITVNLSKEL